MSEEHPDLTALLRGELPNEAALEAADHARGCERCRAELVEDVLGHGLITRARRTLGSTDRASLSRGAPMLSTEVQRQLRRRPRTRVLRSTAAAALLLAAGVGVGVGAVALLSGGQGPRTPVAQRSAILRPVEGSATGTVSMGTVSMGTEHAVTRMRLATHSLPRAPRGDFYYAWLLDPRTNKMLPLGQVSPDRVSTFEVPAPLVASYSAVDVSLEADDGNPAHSVTSVLRATYAEPARAAS